MKAVIWEEEALGAKFHEEEIPAELLEEAKEYREKMIEEISSHDDVLMEKYLSGEAVRARRRSRPPSVPAPSTSRSARSSAVPPSRTRGFRTCWMR